MRKQAKLLANFLGATKDLTSEYAELAEITDKELAQIGYSVVNRQDRPAIVRMLHDKGLSSRKIEQVTGWDHSTIARDLVAFATKTVAFATPVSPATETRQANEAARKAVLEQPVPIKLVDGLYHGDFRELAEQIEDSSAQLVFTDPPYDVDAVALYADAARVAKRILKPGGSFIAYSGQRHLPAVLHGCSAYLRYWWTIAGIHGGGNQILNKLGVRCGWKPLVWFVKDTRGDVQNILMDTVTGGREKDTHEWQQSEQEAAYYIEKLTTPDGLVVDFFVGGGTTAVAARKLGRRWIGFEIDPDTADRASKRIEEAA